MAPRNEPRPLRAVPDAGNGDGYPDWEAVDSDNVSWVYRTLFARVGNRADAEDLTAEVFLAALRPLRLTASVGEVRSYLRTTAQTVLAAHWRETLGREISSIGDRSNNRPIARKRSAPCPNASPGSWTACRTATARSWNCASCREIRSRDSAAELGISVANAKVLQHRALRLAAQVNDGGRS